MKLVINVGCLVPVSMPEVMLLGPIEVNELYVSAHLNIAEATLNLGHIVYLLCFTDGMNTENGRCSAHLWRPRDKNA